MPNTGIGLVAGFSEEATWGTLAGAVDQYLDTHPGMESIEQQVERIEGDDLQARGIDSTHVAAGGRMAGGSLAWDARYGGGWMLFLSQLCGEDPVTAGASPYTHTQAIGAALGGGGGGADNRAKGISLYLDREGQGGGASAKTAAYSGGKPSSMEFTWSYNSRLRIATELFFKEHDSWGTRLTASLPSDAFIIAPSLASSPTSFLQYNSTAYRCRAATLRIEQEWDTERRDMQDALVQVPEINGRVKLSGTFQVEAPATAAGSGGPFFDDYKAKTLRQLVLTSEGATPANEALAITVHKALITKPGEAHPGGPGTVLYDGEWEAYYDSGNSEIASLVLTNSDSAPWA